MTQRTFSLRQGLPLRRVYFEEHGRCRGAVDTAGLECTVRAKQVEIAATLDVDVFPVAGDFVALKIYAG
jgi:hypothetical protein